MKKTIKPLQLLPGDTIGIVSVSAPDAVSAPDWFERGINYLEKEGFKVEVGKSAQTRNGYLSGTEAEMANDVNDFFSQQKIKAIICAGGGVNANRLVPYLNYETITNNPKIFMGVSNPSVLLNAIYAKTGLVTFHGPTVVWNFGNPVGLTDYTSNHLWPILKVSEPFKILGTDNWEWYRKGNASGHLLGGNLISIQSLLGTEWCPDWEGCILFWEDIAKTTDRLDMMLTHFRNAGVFKKIKGMIIGELVNCQEPEGGLSLEKILDDLIGDYEFPVVMNVAIGHTDDKATLPIGLTVEMNSENNTITFLESATLNDEH